MRRLYEELHITTKTLQSNSKTAVKGQCEATEVLEETFKKLMLVTSEYLPLI